MPYELHEVRKRNRRHRCILRKMPCSHCALPRKTRHAGTFAQSRLVFCQPFPEKAAPHPRRSHRPAAGQATPPEADDYDFASASADRFGSFGAGTDLSADPKHSRRSLIRCNPFRNVSRETFHLFIVSRETNHG